jgi:BlaI family penicillinase repressor
MKKPEVKLGKVQLQIMQFLWQTGEATAREITNHLAGQEELSHSTVQTLLRKLEKKGAVRHIERDRIFVFMPVAQESEVTASSTRDFLSRVFQGSIAGLVSHILEHEDVGPEELQRLKTLIDSHVEESK